MKINKEGKTIITVTTIVCALAAIVVTAIFGSGPVSIAVWCGAAVITLFCMAFFREPKRELLQDESLVFSPCDGKVVVCEDVTETEFLGQRCMQVSIFMSLTNIHINWYPVSGKIEYFRHHNGKFMVAWHPKSSEENEHTTTAVSTPRGTIVFRQVAGLVAQRIVSYAEEGKTARTEYEMRIHQVRQPRGPVSAAGLRDSRISGPKGHRLQNTYCKIEIDRHEHDA